MIFEDNTAYQTYRILVAIFCSAGMFASTAPIKPKYKRNLLIITGYAVYVTVLCFIFIRLWGFLPLLRSAVFTISIPGIILAYKISDTSLSRHLFNCMSQLLLSFYLIVSVTLLNTYFGGSLLSCAILLPLAYLIVIFLEFFFLRRMFLKIADTITKGWGILALIPSSFFILIITIEFYPAHYTQNSSSIVLMYLSGAVILIIYYAIFKYLWTQYNLSVKEQDREILELQIQNIKSHAADTKRKAQQAHMLRQDTVNMLSAVETLAKAGNTEAILDYVNNYAKETSAFDRTATLSHYCSDPILNATLSTYLGRAQNSGIILETYLSIPDTLPVDSAELSICFANALENSINACEKLPKNERKIVVKCIHKPKLMFEISNPYKGKVAFTRNGLPYSPKTGHGFGSRSIMAFCEKHNAFHSFTAEDGWFKVTIAL